MHYNYRNHIEILQLWFWVKWIINWIIKVLWFRERILFWFFLDGCIHRGVHCGALQLVWFWSCDGIFKNKSEIPTNYWWMSSPPSLPPDFPFPCLFAPFPSSTISFPFTSLLLFSSSPASFLHPLQALSLPIPTPILPFPISLYEDYS